MSNIIKYSGVMTQNPKQTVHPKYPAARITQRPNGEGGIPKVKKRYGLSGCRMKMRPRRKNATESPKGNAKDAICPSVIPKHQ